MDKTDSIDPSFVAFAIITSYPRWYKGKRRSTKHIDKIRGDLALEFLKIASNKGFQVVVVDGKSTKTFYKELAKIPKILVKRRFGTKRSPGRRKAIKIASNLDGVKVICMSEPEKLSLLNDCMPLIVLPLLNDKADVVVPKRDEKLFKETYPHYMYESEKEGNSFYNEVLRTNGLLSPGEEDLDMFFGPRAFRHISSVRPLFMKRYIVNASNLSFTEEYFDTEEFSNTLYFPITLAIKKKLRVQSVTVPFEYHKNQKENEEKGARELFLEKRKTQRLELLVELLHFVSFLNQNKYSRVKKVI